MSQRRVATGVYRHQEDVYRILVRAAEGWTFRTVHGTQAEAEQVRQEITSGVRPVPKRKAPEPVPGKTPKPRKSRNRNPEQPKGKSISYHRLSRSGLRLLPLVTEYTNHGRPRTRADCLGGERPCPWVSCRYHLFLDVLESGALRLNFPNPEPWEMANSCALDLAAEREGMTLEEAGAVMNLTRERVRQIEDVALLKVATAARAAELHDLAPEPVPTYGRRPASLRLGTEPLSELEETPTPRRREK